MQKKWKVHSLVPKELFVRFPDINSVILQLLHNRDIIEHEKIEEFLRCDWHTDVYDPFLFSDMNKAIARIFMAIEKGERITVFGDYDADGVCGTTILFSTLKKLGVENVGIYIPHRETEGYGLNKNALDIITQDGTQLIITVDLGVSNIEEVEYAQNNGMDVIVVDHHEFHMQDGKPIFPHAHAIIHARTPRNPYPFKYLCGAGTAFKLAQALLRHSFQDHEAFEKWLLDLVAIATIADMVPLVGENRTLTKYGLMVLNKTQRKGLRKLIELARLKGNGNGEITTSNHYNLDSWNVAFQIAPRINAASRISHANDAFSLLIAEADNEVEALANHLNITNQERQKMSDALYKEALKLIGEVTDDSYILCAYKPEWPLGIVGLVAGKISNEFYRPVILMCDAEGAVAGSGRSIAELDLMQTLERTKEYLERYGGHAAACGFKLAHNNYDEFISAIKNVSRAALEGKELAPTLMIDSDIAFSQVSWELINTLQQFEPFGMDNPAPLFRTTGLMVEEVDTVGSTQKHLKFILTDPRGTVSYPAIGFGLANSWKDELQKNSIVDIVYELGVNQWNGNKEIQIKIKDIKESE